MKQLDPAHKRSDLSVDKVQHGGSLNLNRRKSSRPIELGKAHHFVFRSQRAKGKWSLLKDQNRRVVDRSIFVAADKFQIRIYRFANSGNHLHLLLKAPSLKSLHGFLRRVTGVIAQRVSGARKGLRVGRFWDSIPYSRVVSWGRDFKVTALYVLQNIMESLRIIPLRSNANEPRLTKNRIKFIESMWDDDAFGMLTAVERLLNRV